MAVVEFYEQIGRSGTRDRVEGERTLTADERGDPNNAGKTSIKTESEQRTHTRVFYAKTDVAQDYDQEVLDHGECPKLGDPHPADTSAKCVNVSCDHNDGSRFFWIIEAQYETPKDEDQEDQEEEDQEEEEDPTQDPPTFAYTMERREKVAQVAIDDKQVSLSEAKQQLPRFKGIVNSASDPFDPPPMLDKWVLICTFSYKRWHIDIPGMLPLLGAVNDADFGAIKKGTGRFIGISAQSEKTERGRTFLNITATFEIDPDGHKLRLLDYGPNHIDAADGVKKAIVDEKGHPIEDLLDGGDQHGGTGDKLGADEDHKFLEFDVHEAKDFGDLIEAIELPIGDF